MILHLVDEEKITSRIIQSFEEALPGENLFLCFPNKVIGKSIMPSGVVYIYEDDKIIKLLPKIDKVFIHFLHYGKIGFIEKYIKKDIPCYWFIWGGDIYNDSLNKCGYDIYADKSRFSMSERKNFYLNKYHLHFRSYYHPIFSFIKDRIRFFCTNKEEFALLKRYIPQFISGELCEGFFYYPVDDIVGENLKEKKVKGNNIMLGNSASFTNNHLYAMKYLHKYGIGDYNIVVPLSYGGDAKNTKKISDRGDWYFGEKFHPLINFLPIDDYNKLMLSCEIYVYGNWRQEAVGNILIALYLGAKVYLSKKSPLVQYFRRKGLKIYVLEEIGKDWIRDKMSLQDQMINRRIIKDNYFKKQQIEFIKEVFG